MFRYAQRAKFQVAAEKIRERGGTIFYPLQDPTVSSHLVFPPMPTQEYLVQLPDGTTGTRTRSVPIKGQYRFAVKINKFSVKDGVLPRFRMFDFLCGYHSDVNFSAISIPATAVDKETMRLLSGIENLDKILLEVDVELLLAEAIARRERADLQPPNLDEMRADLQRVVDSVQGHLPAVSLHSHGLSQNGYYDPQPNDMFCPKCFGVVYRNWTRCGKCGYRRQP